MNTLTFCYFFFVAFFGVTLGRITFSCKKIKVKTLRLKEKLKCRDQHLKNYFSPRDHKSLDYECCQDYVDRICDNKIFIKCPENQRKLQSSPDCKSAKELDCSKNADKDWEDEDDHPQKTVESNAKSPTAGNHRGSENEKAAASEGSKTKISKAELRSELLLIVALFFAYFM